MNGSCTGVHRKSHILYSRCCNHALEYLLRTDLCMYSNILATMMLCLWHEVFSTITEAINKVDQDML